MSITKFASVELLSAEVGGNRESRRRLARHLRVHPDQMNRPIGYPLTRTAHRRHAHRAEFDYTPREGYIYVRSRAISSRCNENYDEFGADEIREAYRTFIGKPVFVNHDNADHRKARGVIIDAALHEDRLASGEPDTWVEVLMEIDARNFPKLAKAILAGHIERTSMGVDVAESECSACGNVATTPLEFCEHVPAKKGTLFRKTLPDGTVVEEPVHEKCLTPDTPILMGDGVEIPIAQVEVGDTVLDHLGATRRVTGVSSREVDEDIYVVERVGFWRQTRITGNHPVLVIPRAQTGGGNRQTMSHRMEVGKIAPEFLSVSDVQPGDFVAEVAPSTMGSLVKVSVSDWSVPDPENHREHPPETIPDRFYVPDRAWHGRAHILRACRSCGTEMDLYPSETARLYCSSKCWGDGCARGNTSHGGTEAPLIPDVIEMDRDFGSWCGWFAAEGSISYQRDRRHARSVRFSLHANEGHHAEEIERLGWGLFGVEAHHSVKSNNREVEFFNANLARFMRVLGDDCYTKSLPDEWFSAPIEFLEGFALAHHLGDGDHAGGHTGGKPDEGVMTHDTSSPRLADQFHVIHLMLGHTPTRKRPDLPGGKTKRTVPGHHIRARLDRDAKARFSWGPWVFGPVRSVDTEPYCGVVHNIEVEGTHTYVANHMAVHNCRGLAFFENSLLVEDPADPTAAFTGVDASGIDEPYTGTLKAASSWRKNLPERPMSGVDVICSDGVVTNYPSLGEAPRECPHCGVAMVDHELRPASKMGSRSTLQGVDEAFTEMTRTAKKSSSQLRQVRQQRKAISADDLQSMSRIVTEYLGHYNAAVTWRLQHDPNASAETIANIIAERDSAAVKKMTGQPGYVRDYDEWWPKMVAATQDMLDEIRGSTTGARAARLVGVNEAFSQITGARRHGFGETKVPLDVDTLGDTECPVCGNDSGTYDGTACPSCGYVKPPDPYMDPDLEQAQHLRDEDEFGDETNDDQMIDTDEHEDEDPLRGKPEFRLPKSESRMRRRAQLSAGDRVRLIRDYPDPYDDNIYVADQGDEAIVVEADRPFFEVLVEFTSGISDGIETHIEERALEKIASCPPAHESAAIDGRVHRGAQMPATPQLKTAVRQQRQITRQAELIGQLQHAVKAIAQLAGLENHPHVAALMRQADIENPAQPVPEPGEEAPAQTTEDAAGTVTDENADTIDRGQPEGGGGSDDLMTPGGTSVSDVSPDAQPNLQSAFETVADEPVGMGNQDVTAPVAGTTEQRPLDETRTEVDVRVGDPNAPETMFPIETPAFEGQESTQNMASKTNEKRAWASLRLARLRIEAGLSEGSDITEGQRIAESKMSDEVISHEIQTLTGMAKRQPQATQSSPRQPHQARRSVPSLASHSSFSPSDSTSSVEDAEVLW